MFQYKKLFTEASVWNVSKRQKVKRPVSKTWQAEEFNSAAVMRTFIIQQMLANKKRHNDIHTVTPSHQLLLETIEPNHKACELKFQLTPT